MEEMSYKLNEVISRLFSQNNIEVKLTRPEEQFGDFTTNISMQLAKNFNKNPREIADKIANELKNDSAINSVEVAGPGFINLKVTDEYLSNHLDPKLNKPLAGKVIVAEYSDPNPFKILHAGHVYTTVVGDAIATLLESAGAKVYRVNFGGDVGRHVAITMWAIIKEFGGIKPDKLNEIKKEDRSAWLSERYVQGNTAFESDESIISEIKDYNKRIYRLHDTNNKSSDFAKIYWKCREWSYSAFDEFYERLGVKLDKYYPESQTAEVGLKTVNENTPKVFQKSRGAIVFNGEKYGLHTRVFINSEGLPTYETKDIGLILNKNADYNFDTSVVVTDNEQMQYMQVVLKALEQIYPDLAKKTKYIPHGKLKLKGGLKMSSRKGNIVRAMEVIDVTNEALEKSGRKKDDIVTLAAIKFAFLKVRIGGDVIYDPEESVSLQGSSGPYLQYAHARACSILKKATKNHKKPNELDNLERSLALKISQFNEVVNEAINELMPHLIAVYLYELAQVFNRFYEKNRVIGDVRESQRLYLIASYKNVLKTGLGLLNIQAPEKM